MECFLNELRPGEEGLVLEMPDSALMGRLNDFGMVPRTVVRCRYWGPGGHLTALEFRGAVIALRRSDLDAISVRRM